MRVLLTSNASYVPPRGGSTRSNLAWLEHIAQAGHSCEIVCSAAEQDTSERRDRVRRELEEQRLPVEPEEIKDGVERRAYGAIPVHAVIDPARRPQVLAARIKSFEPDWVLVSSEDLSHALLREAERCAPGRLVYLAHTPQFFPFGPESWNPDPRATAAVTRAAAVIAIGRHAAAYVRENAGRSASVVHPPIYGPPGVPRRTPPGTGLVAMVNPCAVKGISIFLELARALPDVPFGALPGWGTTHADREALATLPNIRILAAVRDIGEVLARTRILLMPSLWYEGFGLIAMEAMLRGVPVIASNSGGLVEAKQNTGYVVPVNPIQRYETAFDDRHMPKPILPPQDLAPWREAVQTLLNDPAAYERESAASHAAAHEFVNAIDPLGLCRVLEALVPRELPSPAQPSEAALARLSPEKRALLLQRLRKSKE